MFSKGTIKIPQVTGNIEIIVVGVNATSTYTNMFVPESAELNKRFSSSGGTSTYNGSFVTDYIDISTLSKDDDVYLYFKNAHPRPTSGSYSCYLMYYDSSKTLIGKSQYGNVGTSAMSGWVITEISAEEEYYKIKLNKGNIDSIETTLSYWNNASYIKIGLFINDTATVITADDVADVVITLNEPIN